MFNEYITVFYSTIVNIHIYHEQITRSIDSFLFDCLEKILSTIHTIFARCSHCCRIIYYLFLNKNRLFCVFIGFEPTCDGNQQVRKCMTRTVSSSLNATMFFKNQFTWFSSFVLHLVLSRGLFVRGIAHKKVLKIFIFRKIILQRKRLGLTYIHIHLKSVSIIITLINICRLRIF